MTGASAPPLVSILTPVYNGAEFIEQCIESVLAQTYGNYEYIIINNCSKDDTLAIAPGLKWNVTDTWIVVANVGIPMTKAGLEAPFLPFLGVEYTLGR